MKNLLTKKLLPFMYLCLVMYWYLFMNRYQTLFFQEQAQLFQFSETYLLQYLHQPAGITGYLTSFLIQFFRYPLAGACIYAVLFFSLYRLFQTVLKQFALFENSLFIPAVPSLLLLPVSAHLQFDVACQLSLVPALAGFAALTVAVKKKFYYLYIPALTVLIYLFSGGNVFLSTLLFVFYALTGKEKKWKASLLSIVVSILVPLFFLRFVYPVPLREACLRYTPFAVVQPHVLFHFHIASWLSILLIPFAGMLFRKIRLRVRNYIYLSVDVVLSVIVAAIILKNYNPNMENVLKMIYCAEDGQWEKILDGRAKMPAGPFSCFYTNLALQKKGELGDKMFHYDQIGVSGLFLDGEDLISCYLMSDLFYQMGVINEARHYAHESMISFSGIREINLLNMKRFVACAIVQKDMRLVAKYRSILDKTLFYGNYIQNHIGSMPEEQPSETGDAVNVFGKTLLVSLLENNPRHQMAFEYLMAYHLLEADYEAAKTCFDTYYSNFNYASIPVHYAEFLILYKHVNYLNDDFFEKYPVPKLLRENFEIMDTLLLAKMNTIDIVEKQFKDTYWYYIRFPMIAGEKKQKKTKDK
jgi:hypothetical protein